MAARSMCVATLVNAIDAARPFGGLKADWGREHGIDAVNAYTEAQIIGNAL